MRQWWLYRNIGYFSEEMPEYTDRLEAHVVEFAECEKLKMAMSAMHEQDLILIDKMKSELLLAGVNFDMTKALKDIP